MELEEFWAEEKAKRREKSWQEVDKTLLTHLTDTCPSGGAQRPAGRRTFGSSARRSCWPL